MIFFFTWFFIYNQVSFDKCNPYPVELHYFADIVNKYFMFEMIKL